MDNCMITVKNLTKTYQLYESNRRRILEGIFPFVKQKHKDFHALSNISFEIKKGEIVGIIGKNGSGKSTLLKIITGVLTQTSGTVVIRGKISALLELGTGFNPEYSGMENIYLAGIFNGIPRAQMEKRVDDILDFAEIGDFIKQPVKNYSSGMFVRLAFAVAVCVEPEILIVDEALSVGDAAFQAKCMARMMQIIRNGATVLFVTHDMDMVKRLCERCIYLDHGQIIKEGAAAELADLYLRRAREKMNQENKGLLAECTGRKAAEEKGHPQEDGLKKDGVSEKEDETEYAGEDVYEAAFVKDDSFEKQVQRFREGDGAVRVIRAEVLDEEGVEQIRFAYNQEIQIKIYVQFYSSVSNVGVGYHIRDGKNTEIIGSGMRFEHTKLLSGQEGDIFCVVFTTKLPLMAGAYNVTLVISNVMEGNQAVFHDYIENAKVFEVSENEAGKLWNKVYIPNNVVIKKFSRSL